MHIFNYFLFYKWTLIRQAFCSVLGTALNFLSDAPPIQHDGGKMKVYMYSLWTSPPLLDSVHIHMWISTTKYRLGCHSLICSSICSYSQITQITVRHSTLSFLLILASKHKYLVNKPTNIRRWKRSYLNISFFSPIALTLTRACVWLAWPLF